MPIWWDVLQAGVPWTWETFPEYLATVDRLPKAINYGAYIGHSALRMYVMGKRALTEAATRFNDRSDPAPEKIQDEAAGSYDRALASLIIAIANITSGPASTPPPGQAGRG